MRAHDTIAGYTDRASPRIQAVLSHIIVWGCAGAMLLGVLGLAGWLFDRPLYASLLAGAKPIAPSAALFIILFAIILYTYGTRGWRAPLRYVSVALAAILVLFGLLETVTHYLHLVWCPSLVLSLILPALGTPEGMISPIASMLTCAVGIAVLTLALPVTRTAMTRRAYHSVGWLGLLTVLISGTFTLGYFYGTPLLYGTTDIPIALSASLGFGLLGCVVMAVAGADVYPLKWFTDRKTRARLLRIFLPFIVVAVLITDILQVTIHRFIEVNDAVVSLVSTLGVVLLSSFLISMVTRQLGNDIDRARRRRMQAEQELAKEKELLLVTLRSIGDAVIATDCDGHVALLNNVAEQLTGWTSSEARGRPISEIFRIVNEYTGEPVESPINTILQEGCVVGLANHTMLISRDGTEYSIADSGSPIRDADERIIGVVLVFRDVTEERRAEAALRESEERFRVLFETLGDGIIIANTTGEITHANQMAEHLLGLTLAQMQGRVAPDQRRRIVREDFTDFPDEESPIGMALATGQAVQDVVMGVFHPEEQVYTWMNIKAKPIIAPGEARPRMVYATYSNITLRKRALAALQESEQRYRELFDSNPHPMWVYDRASLAFLAVNEATIRYYGYSRDEFAAMTILDLHPPETHAALREAIRQSHDIQRTAVWHHQAKDGARYDMEITTHDLRYLGRDGRLVHANDITERTRAEQALTEEREKLKSILDTMAAGVLIAGADYSIQYINPSLEREFGPVAGLKCYEYLHALPAPCPCCRNQASEIGCTVKCEWQHETTGKYYDYFDTPLRFSDGGIAKLELLHDITAHKRIEQALRESELRYHALFDSAMDGILVLRDGQLVDCNLRAVEMFGGTREQVLGQTFDSLSPAIQPTGQGSQILAEQFFRQALDGKPQSFEWCHRRFDGTTFSVEVSVNQIHLNGDPLLLAITRDITERKHVEAQLRQAAKMESIGQLAGGVAHDFNNILTGIVGLTQITRVKAGEESPFTEDLDEVLTLANRAANLTRQLLAFSRRQPIQPQVLNLNLLVENMLKMVNRLIGEDISLRFSPASDLGMICADLSQIEQLLMNLVVNARDAMPEGGVLTIETANVYLDEDYTQLHTGVQAGSYVQLTVSDSGIGMDEETRRHIFEPFFTTKGVGQGTGLGLATVYGIIKQHGGSIWVYSEVGQGAVFKVYLPRHDNKNEHPDASAQLDPLPRGHETILLVEDEAAVRDVTRRILENHGYTVLAAAAPTEAEAIFALHGEEIILLLSDVIMPERNGIDLYEAFARRRPGLKVLFMSGYSDSMLPHAHISQTSLSLLQKPFNLDDLLRRIRRILDAPSQQEEIDHYHASLTKRDTDSEYSCEHSPRG